MQYPDPLNSVYQFKIRVNVFQNAENSMDYEKYMISFKRQWYYVE